MLLEKMLIFLQGKQSIYRINGKPYKEDENIRFIHNEGS